MTQKRNEDRLLKMAAKIKETYQPAEIAQLVRLIEPTPSTGEMSAEDFERLMQELDATSTRRGYSENLSRRRAWYWSWVPAWPRQQQRRTRPGSLSASL